MDSLPITHRYGKHLSHARFHPPDAPSWIADIDNPYLHGVLAPTTREARYDTLEVIEGRIPDDLHGAYLRNGTNPRFKPKNRYHWFDGDAMVHGIWFEGGQARYLNRYVETKAFALESEAQAAIWPGVLGPFDFSLPLSPIKDTANTDLVAFDGKLYALWYESGAMVSLDPRTLETLGRETFGGALRFPVSAHSKVDPNTGELLVFGYGDRAPFMRYGVVRPDGRVHTTDITLPGPRRPHDLGVSASYCVLHDFPIFHSEAVFQKTGKRVPLFHREVPTRFGVIPRYGTDADVRWFEFEPCYMLHTVNCYEEGDWLVQVGCRTDDPVIKGDPRDGELASMISFLTLQAGLYEWRMNLRTGETKERSIDRTNAEFPTFDRRRMGHKNRYAYLQDIPYEAPATFDGLLKFDFETERYERYAYGKGVFGSEAPFAPRTGSTEEDDGYVLSFVTDVNDWSSACLVFDARRIPDGPVAKVRIPHRMPAGFHALWVPA